DPATLRDLTEGGRGGPLPYREEVGGGAAEGKAGDCNARAGGGRFAPACAGGDQKDAHRAVSWEEGGRR
ncbi:hypothetical protein, partial [Methanoculleus chikugoensis]|uniref:hypothetical protein n=1 Tax=Methanoculleus chikugoensis TaxID=118126 RepID=UPI001FB4C206